MNDFVYHTKQLYCELIAVQIDSFGCVVTKKINILIATQFDLILTRAVSILGHCPSCQLSTIISCARYHRVSKIVSSNESCEEHNKSHAVPMENNMLVKEANTRVIITKTAITIRHLAARSKP